jgi:hypothetical protein
VVNTEEKQMKKTITITEKSYRDVMMLLLIALGRVANYAESDEEKKDSDELMDRATLALNEVFDQVGITDGGL